MDPLEDDLRELTDAINACDGTCGDADDSEADTALAPTEPDIESLEPFPLPGK